VAAVSSPPRGESGAGSQAAPRDVDAAATFPSAPAAQGASGAAVSSPPRGESSAGSRPRPATWTSQPLSLPPKRRHLSRFKQCPLFGTFRPGGARGQRGGGVLTAARGIQRGVPGRALRRGRRSHFPFRPGGARGQRGGGVLTAARGIQRGVPGRALRRGRRSHFPFRPGGDICQYSSNVPFLALSAPAAQGASVAAVSSPPHRESSAGSQAAPCDVDVAATFPSAPAATSVKIQAMSPFWHFPPRRRKGPAWRRCPHRRAGNPARGPGRALRRGRRSHFPFRPGVQRRTRKRDWPGRERESWRGPGGRLAGRVRRRVPEAGSKETARMATTVSSAVPKSPSSPGPVTRRT
jgi:hypothetical protein